MFAWCVPARYRHNVKRIGFRSINIHRGSASQLICNCSSLFRQI